jgi:DNA-binding CsgD family transcriptional regulator
MPEKLTRLEQQIVLCVLQGLTPEETSRRLVIRSQEVQDTLKNIYSRIGISDVLELLLYACSGLISLGDEQDETAA